ncbi:MAG: hypothetical protein ABW186_02035 [Rhodanobacteraceae bacterium]
MKMRIAFAVAALVCLGGVAGAKENYHENSVKADTKEAFDQLADTVRSGMGDGGKYEYVKPQEKVTIEKKLNEMDSIFDAGGGSVATMKEEQKIALFNAQETVNSILTLRDRDRVICKKEAPVGSHIPVTSCHSYAQEVEAREGTKKQLEEWGRGQCRDHCGGP